MSKRFIAAGMLSSLLLIGGNLADAQAITVAQQTAGTCVGTIVSENGEEVIGATVKVKGTSMATSTNIDGKFSSQVLSRALFSKSAALATSPFQ